jgi:hypothetical protein
MVDGRNFCHIHAIRIMVIFINIFLSGFRAAIDLLAL